MAITFPRELPAVKFVTADFQIEDGVAATATRGRLMNFTNYVDPFWTASLVTKSLRFSEFSAVQSWWLTLRGGTSAKGVLFRHPHICYPKAHWNNHAPADDEGVLSSVAEGNVLTVNSVSPDLELTAGVDFIGIEFLGRYYVGKVVEVAGSGTSRIITVEPPPYSAVKQAGAIVRFAKIPLLMRPVPGSFSHPQNNGRYTVSFKLQEAG